MRVQFLGSGDAFGSGGRLQTCLHVEVDGESLLLDCGASSLIAMKRAAVEPSGITSVVVTHLHGDHFAGLPFLVLDGQFRRRGLPLLVAGPPGVEERVRMAMEVLFPGSSGAPRRFSVTFVELQPRMPVPVGPALVTAFPVEHASGAPAYAVRVRAGDKELAYSGDTEWTDALLEAARGVDLFICEAYFFEKRVRYHLDYQTLRDHLERLECSRVVLTHMSQDMLDRRNETDLDAAEDGLVLTL